MTETESFERAFVAMSRLLGCRAALEAGLVAPGPAAVRTAERLSSQDRAERARRLAAELAPIVAALLARRAG